jgi:hypothetical protein
MGKEEKKSGIAQWNRTIIPPRVTQRAYERWWSDGDCWISDYSVGSHGYAQIGWQDNGKTHTVLAHRASWEHVNGAVPAGMTMDHLCKQRQCVNPDHLRILDNYENARRTGGRDWPLGQCVNGHSNEHLADHNGSTHCTICVTTIWKRGGTKVGQFPSPNVYREPRPAPPKPPKLFKPKREKLPTRGTETHCRRGHEWNEENTYHAVDGKRLCKPCRAGSARQKELRKKEERAAALESAQKSLDTLLATSLTAEQYRTIRELMDSIQELTPKHNERRLEAV